MTPEKEYDPETYVLVNVRSNQRTEIRGPIPSIGSSVQIGEKAFGVVAVCHCIDPETSNIEEVCVVVDPIQAAPSIITPQAPFPPDFSGN